ncbi:UDP-glucose--hexose-1-phosphate uridylyltransferase [Bacillus gobiensis]|uniref:UDP-glucose--hexose-1-phosphate uridylyltransferase n=1 Tax=Bacillus gobiensis TaxID=1441095 RepID=UPI003D1C3FA3
MNIDIYQQIEKLIQFGINKKLITKWDIDAVRNTFLDVLKLDDYQDPAEVVPPKEDSPAEILGSILDWSAENGLLEADTVTYRDLFDTRLMACFVPFPSEVNRRFFDTYEKEGAKAATAWYYQFSRDINYIRTDRIRKNQDWTSQTEYGDMQITINLSKPEKDIKAIAAAKDMKEVSYPKCLLCKENTGYAGRVNHPARQNLRIIPVELGGEQWFLQFSPYVYYHEHAIIFAADHAPMTIERKTFDRLFEFVRQYPHYFIGSNADLPIVGGSILSHEHFQGGYHEFPMAKAEIEKEFTFKGYPGVTAGTVKWPMSVIRLRGKDADELAKISELVLEKWKNYSDEQSHIRAFSGETRHNTVTPIARMRDEEFEIDLVLRNNRTNEEYPSGIFHPHEEVHHIKKENIGLIEVMGLAILPGRLLDEMALLAKHICDENFEEKIDPSVEKHLTWAKEVKRNHPELKKENASAILKDEIGKVFSTILEHAGVFKRDEEGQKGFARFIDFVTED